jgi:hypothetical protein
VATYRIVAWKGIPASVEAEDGRDAVTRQLSDRFQMLIDSVAMQLGLDGSEAYIELWSRGEPQERAGSAQEVADAVAADLEGRFPQIIGTAFNKP